MLIADIIQAPRVHSKLTIDSETLAHEDLFSRAGAVASEAQERGGAAVAVDAMPTVSTVAAVLGGLAAGVPVVPLPPDGGVSELAHMLRDSGSTAIYTDRPDHYASLGLAVQCRQVPSRSKHPLSPTVSDADATAVVLYTSGTTGQPKGVSLSQAAIRADLKALFDRWQVTPDDTVAHGLPLYHVHGLILGVLGPLMAGAGIIHTGKPTPERYAAARKEGASTYFAVPTVWSRVCRAPVLASALTGARLLVSGSAALPPSVFVPLQEMTGCPVLERYGMTETMITVSTALDRPRLPGMVGWAIEGVDTRIVDEAGTPMEHGAARSGDLQVRGPIMFNGYLHMPEATAASFTEDGWFRTGDVATIDADGCHRIVGRASTDLIKSGGFRIGAGEIEDSLRSHPGVRDCAVIGVPDDDLGQRIEAFVLAEDAAVTEQALVNHVACDLSFHKRPRKVHFVSDLPRNHMGKVQKTQLLDKR